MHCLFDHLAARPLYNVLAVRMRFLSFTHPVYEMLCCVNYCIHVPPDKVTYYLWLLLLFCVLYQQKKFSDADTSRPPTGHHRLAPIQDTLTSNVSLCVVCNGTGSCIATFAKILF